jgi:hypothetical protein
MVKGWQNGFNDTRIIIAVKEDFRIVFLIVANICLGLCEGDIGYGERQSV